MRVPHGMAQLDTRLATTRAPAVRRMVVTAPGETAARIHRLASGTLFTPPSRRACNDRMGHLTSHARPARAKRITALSLSAVAIVGASLTAAAPAFGDTPEQSCWTDVDTGAVQCFDSSLDPIEAIEELSGESVLAIPDGQEAPLTTEGTFTIFVLALAYDNTGFGSPTMSYTTTDSAICGDEHDFGDLGSWSDRIESFQGMNGCSAIFYRDVNFGTVIFGPAASSTNMGSANNQASSIKFG